MTNVNCNALLYFTKVFLDKMLEKNEGHKEQDEAAEQ